jgi:1-aminocyclopropane-1-carboxylate deaminase
MSEDEFIYTATKVPMQSLPWEFAKKKGVEVIVRRDDLIDSHFGGNKFYKLFYNLRRAREQGHQQLLSYGGAYSNHIYALAAAGRQYGFSTIGLIRGERPSRLSPTLQDAENWGMRLHFMSRSNYKVGAAELNEDLVKTYGSFYSIPEGGANDLGMQGTRVLGLALSEQIKNEMSDICLACGTATTLAGVSAGLATGTSLNARVIGFSVLKGVGNLTASVVEQHRRIEVNINNWCVISGYHAGGYAKKLPASLSQFYRSFEQETLLRLDPVYTLKMFWGVAQLLAQNYWSRGSRLVLIHTGGLQGCRGFVEASC